MKTDIAGVNVDNLLVTEALEKIDQFVLSGQPHYIVTPYSEFIVEANTNEKYKAVLNNADLSLADGIGIIWAARFLSMPKRGKMMTIVYWLVSLCSIVFAPQSLRSVIKEQITGSRFIWEIARLASEKNYSISLVGGFGEVAKQSAEVLKNKFPGLKINLAFGPENFDQSIERISASKTDILLIAYQPPRQEIWIADNLKNLNVKVAIGLGGTFDYLAGKRIIAPKWINYLGLEWFWRLLTQPWRIKRMWRAIVEFSVLIFRYKLNHT